MDSRLVFCLFLLMPFSNAGRDNQGYEFIMNFMANYVSGTANNMELFITTMSNIDANINVTLPLYDSTFLETAVVKRTQIVKVEIPVAARGSFSTGKENKGIWVQSDQEVIVFGVNKEQYSTDAFQALPVDVMAREYYALTYIEEAEIGIVATEDTTAVTVVLPVNANKLGSLAVNYNGNTYTNGDTFTFNLDRFETFQVTDSNSLSDFSGAHITSDKPIGVLCGNLKVDVPYNKGGSSDHLTEQLAPLDTLGKRFYTYSTPERARGDIIRILGTVDSTTVTVTYNSTSASTLNVDASEFLELDIDSGTHVTIDSSKGVVVALFSKTNYGSSDGPNGGDPAMTYLLPAPQWASDYTYSTIRTPSNTVFINQIVIHIHPNNTGGLRLDQNNVTGVTWMPITGVADMVVGVIDVSDGSHNIYHIDPTNVFSAISTGVASANSYAFATGTRMALINTPCSPTAIVAGDIVDNDCDGRIDEETANGVDDDGDGQIDEDLAFPPRVEGNWGSWSSWTNCSETCEAVGNQTRTRACDNPAAANNGQDCIGAADELNVCDMTAIVCLVDGNWTAWTTWDNCTGTCGTGTQFRDRNCTNPEPAGGGANCSGSVNETQSCVPTVACAVTSSDDILPLALGDGVLTLACAVTSSDDILPLALGAGIGGAAALAALAACCCLLYPIARKKLRDDDEEESEDEEDEEERAHTARDVNIEDLDGPTGSPPASTGINRIHPA